MAVVKRIELSDGMRTIIRAFQPEELNEDNFDAFYYDKTMDIRMGYKGDSPMDNLFDDCTTPLAKNAHLLSGHRGCGKSTELFALKRRLEEAGHPVCIIYCQSEMNMDLADCWDIMLLISEGLCLIADEKGIGLPDDLVGDMFSYILQDVEASEEFTQATNINIGLVLSLIASIKSGLQMGDTQRITLKTKMERRGSDWRRYVDEISNIITDDMQGKQPILIFEDLDKIEPSNRALDIFRYNMLTKMKFPVIYTFPIAEVYNPRFAALKGLYKTHKLPMIKVRNIDKTENEVGIGVIRKIIDKRADLRFFDDRALDLLITQTGGVLRHLFECILTACRITIRIENTKIEADEAKRALEGLTSDLMTRIPMTDNRMLINIYEDTNYKKQLEETSSVLQHMHGLVVLEYQNGERWHDLHPLVADFLKKRGAIGGSRSD